MKTLIAAVIVGGICAPASSQTASSGFSCESAGFHPDPYNCAVFYRCVSFWGGRELRPVKFSCKEPTVFDSTQKVCQFPWKMRPPCVKNADGMWVREDQQTTMLPSVDSLPNITVLELGSPDFVTSPPPTYRVAADSPFACPGPGEHFASIDDSCVFYYQCSEIEPGLLSAVLYRCREGEIFTETTRQCLRPYPLPPCGQTGDRRLRPQLAGVVVEQDVYDDRDFYLELEFKK